MKALPGFMLASLAALCWALAIILSKISLDHTDTGSLFLIQIIAATGVAWLFMVLRKERIARNKKMLWASSTGIFEPFLAYMLSLYGLNFTPAGLASVIFSTESIWIVILSIVLLKAKPKPLGSFLSLLAISFIAALLVILPDIQAGDSGRLSGYGAVMAGVFFAALYVVVSSRLIETYSPSVLLTGQLTFCAMLSVIGLAPFVESGPLTWNIVLLAAISGILQYYLAFYFYLLSLRWIKVHIAGAMLYLIPVFSLLLAFVILGESVTAIQVSAIVILLCCLFFLNQRFSTAAHEAKSEV